MSNNDTHIKKQLDKYNDTRSNRKKLRLERTAVKNDTQAAIDDIHSCFQGHDCKTDNNNDQRTNQ